MPIVLRSKRKRPLTAYERAIKALDDQIQAYERARDARKAALYMQSVTRNGCAIENSADGSTVAEDRVAADRTH